jgi:hypothetical protein
MNRFASTSLTIAATFLSLTIGANAQPMQSMQLNTVNARLSKALDTSNAMQGQIVSAKLIESVNANGMKLAKGSELIGHIVTVQAAQGGSGATLTILFDKAHSKDGKEMPVHATLVDIARFDAPEIMTAPVASDATYVVDNRLDGISLKSSVTGGDSGTLSNKDKNIKLDSGTDLLLAVSPATSNSNSGN